MNDLDLETRIRAAAPQVSSPLGLAEHSARILHKARAGHSRNLRTWAVGVAASVLIVGGGTVAVAGNDLQTPWGYTADNVYQFPGPNGQTCVAGLTVKKSDELADDAAVVVTAREFVAGLDLNTVDTSAATAFEEAQNYAPFVDGTPGGPHSTPEQIKLAAMHGAVADLLWAELEDRGLLTPAVVDPVWLTSVSGCQ